MFDDRGRERDAPDPDAVEHQQSAVLSTRLPSATTVGSQIGCSEKNARLSSSITPLKASPSEKAASASADDRRLVRAVEGAALVEQAHDAARRARRRRRSRARAGTRSAACRWPTRVARKPRMSPRATSRESVGKSTVATATENMPCGSM